LDKGAALFDRETSRNPCHVLCGVLVSGAQEPAVMKDYAERGFKVGTRRALLVGTDIALVLPGCHPVRAKVMWSLGGMAGCRFEEPIREHLMRAALEKLSDEGAADGLPF
jgi:hypothetical protein